MRRKMILIHLLFGVISLAILYKNFQGPGLIWNMTLALVALDFAVLFKQVKNRLLKLVFGLLWLFFYPNTFYMLTDIVHMHFTSTVLWERSSMILFMLYVPSILLGVMSGILSVRYAFEGLGLKQAYGRLVAIAFLSGLSSFAIHIGRYARLNSWDIFTRPLVVVEEMWAVVSHEALPFIIGFTFIQMMTLIFMEND